MHFDAHNHAFRVLGGVSQRGIFDNIKTAVDKIKKGKAGDVNMRHVSMMGQSGSSKRHSRWVTPVH
jgi:transposase